MSPGVVCHAAGGAENPPPREEVRRHRRGGTRSLRPRLPAGAHRRHEALPPLGARAHHLPGGAPLRHVAPQQDRESRPLKGGCCGPLWPAQYSSVNSPVDYCRSLWSRSVSGPGVSGFTLGGSCDSPHSPSRVPGGFGPGPVPGGSGDSNDFLEKPTGSPNAESATAFISNRRGGVVEYKASGRCFIETVLGQQRLVSDPCRGLFRFRARASPSPNPLPHPLVLGLFVLGTLGSVGARSSAGECARCASAATTGPNCDGPLAYVCALQNIISLSLFADGSGAGFPFHVFLNLCGDSGSGA